MKTLVINGSLKGKASHSMMVAEKFVEGLKESTGTDVRTLELGPMNIEHCRGCFACWKVTPGTCAIRDDMDIIKDAILESDVVVLSFPLYFFGMSSKMTTMLNRLLPLKMPYKGKLATKENPVIMDFRYDLSHKKLVLVSSCAHASTDMVYDAVTAQFDMIFGKDSYTTVFTPQGEILMLDKMKPILNAYLNKVRAAGAEFGQNGCLCDETHKKVCAPLIPVRAVEKMMTGYWEDYPQ